MLDLDATIKDNTLHVSFLLYRDPFTDYNDIWYPVTNYCMIIVKHKNCNTFSISTAEDDLIHYNNVYEITKDERFLYTPTRYGDDFDCTDITDSDGDPIVTGDKYCVFLLAILDQQYKKNINNFENYLSLPSDILFQ